MKKGFFSHQLCYRDSLLSKHVIYMSLDNCFDAVFPFQREVSLTTFCEGVLFVVDAIQFCGKEALFIEQLQAALDSDEALKIGDAIVSNPLFQASVVQDNQRCALYAIPAINWSTLRHKGELTISRIV